MGKFDLNRRQFLGALSLGTAHLMFHNPLYGANGDRRWRPPGFYGSTGGEYC
jgi:hypothetical protein